MLGHEETLLDRLAGAKFSFCPRQVHALEDQLSDTIGYLSRLERSSVSLQNAMQNSGLPEETAQQQFEERDDLSGSSPTSQVAASRNFMYHYR